jgi:hypothetical protein
MLQGTPNQYKEHNQGSGTHKGAQRRRNTKVEKEQTFSKY